MCPVLVECDVFEISCKIKRGLAFEATSVAKNEIVEKNLVRPCAAPFGDIERQAGGCAAQL